MKGQLADDLRSPSSDSRENWASGNSRIGSQVIRRSNGRRRRRRVAVTAAMLPSDGRGNQREKGGVGLHDDKSCAR